MKKLLCLLFLSLALISCTSSKRISFLDMEALKQQSAPSVDLPLYEEKYGEYDGVYLSLETIVEHSGIKEHTAYGLGDKWTYSYIRKMKYIIFNPEADWLTNLDISSNADNLFIRITSPAGVSKQYGIKDLQVEKDKDGYTSRKFAIPEVVKGTLVEVAYDYEFNIFPGFASYFLDHETLLQSSIPIEYLKFSFAYPEWWRVKVKQIGEKRGVPYLESNDIENKKNILYYETKDVPALTHEPYSPYFKEVANYIQLMIVDFAMMGGTYQHPGSWQELGEQFKKYVLKKSDKGSKRLRNIVDEIIAENASGVEKLEAIIGYIYDTIKIGKSRDANYEKILKDKEGSQYDMTGLAQAMLAEAGMESYYLLVHDAEDGYLDLNYISADQLYVPALHVPIDGVDYVVFPYIKNLPINHTPENFQGQTALALSEAEDGTGFWQVPAGNRADNALDANYHLVIDADGGIAVTEKRVLRGSMAYMFRREFSDLSEEKIRDAIKDLLTYSAGDVKLDTYSLTNFENYKLPLEIEMTYSIANLVTVTPEEVIFQTGGLFSPVSNRVLKLEQEKRINPIQIAYDEQYIKNIEIAFPPQWRISNNLMDIEFANQFGSLMGQYSIESGLLRVSQRVTFNKIMVSKDQIGDLIDLAGTRSALNVPTIIFSVDNEI